MMPRCRERGRNNIYLPNADFMKYSICELKLTYINTHTCVYVEISLIKFHSHSYLAFFEE